MRLSFALVPVTLLGVFALAQQPSAIKDRLPVGDWKVEFSNGVAEKCMIGNGGELTVEEPARRAMGMAEAKGGAVVITYTDDRIERWTPVGREWVVEHWFPASRVPTVAPVLGIARRTE